MKAPASEGWFEEPAPAKINLYLHLVDRRSDGYHLLDSLIAFAGVHDTVAAAFAERLELKASGPFARSLSGFPPSARRVEGENLIERAARRLAEAAGIKPEAEIRLCKRLPVAAGVGGGSADAAATLRVLARLWELRPSEKDLLRLALELGADVPVCLKSRPAFVGGIGEALKPAPGLPAAHLVLVNPGAPLETGKVFAAHNGAFSKPSPFASGLRGAADLARILKKRRNDLESAARELAPEVGEALACLGRSDECLLARMSGSGATCFGLFETEAIARREARRIAGEEPGWWVESTLLIEGLDAIDCLPVEAC